MGDISNPRLATLAICGLAASLAACGSGGSEATEDYTVGGGDPVVAVPANKSANEKQGRQSVSPFRGMTVAASGDIVIERRFGPGEMSLSGGCIGAREMAFGASDRANPTGADVFLVSFKAEEVPEQEQIGTFALEKVTLWNGGTKFEYGHAPNVFEGPGRLVLTKHEGRGHNGEMRGRVYGDLVNSTTGEQAKVEADFHYGMGCGN